VDNKVYNNLYSKVIMFKKFKVRYIVLIIFLILFFYVIMKSPTNNREWSDDQQVLSFAEFEDNVVNIYNIRNISYRNVTDFDIYYYNRTVDLKDLETLDYVIEELDGFPGFAHTFLSFGFKDGTYIAVSIEVRKEKEEKYNPILGLLNKYELMYVIADERDVINLRTNYRNDVVYLYPINISKESLDKLFVGILMRTNKLNVEPEFYNTFTSTCASNLAKVVSETTKVDIFKYNYKVLLPAYSDELLLKRGLIKTNLTNIDLVRGSFRINDKAKFFEFSDGFSKGIRE